MNFCTVSSLLLLSLILAFANTATAEPRPAGMGDEPSGKHKTQKNQTSPARRIERDRHDGERAARSAEFRSMDGTGNHLVTDSMNSAHTALARWTVAAYGDLSASPAGSERPNAREISNIVIAQDESMPNSRSASDFLWQWGQFLDHDLDLTDGVDPAEPTPIPVPAGDAWFDPDATGTQVIPFNRSIYQEGSGTEPVNPRAQLNEITGWIDGSQVYGSDDIRAVALRTNDGTGRLRTSEGGMLPFNTEGLANAGGSGAHLFLAGDVRANEQIGLTVMHTLFVREHNRLADEYARKHPEWSGERIYQNARRYLTAELQVITYKEFLPLLIGDVVPAYRGYDSSVDASIANIFATAAFRLGHSMLSPELLRLDAHGEEIDSGHLSLREAFFAPNRLATEGGIEPMLRGLAAQVCQSVDNHVIDDVRNFLFGQPGAGGFDLAALNIQRGRDHGLPDYNSVRQAMGLQTVSSFTELSSSPEVQSRLASVYADVGELDVWVGGLAEDPVPGALVGELFQTILARQFRNLRDGDRYWHELELSREELDRVRDVRLSDIIRRNTNIDREISDDVFVVSAASDHRQEDRRTRKRR